MTLLLVELLREDGSSSLHQVNFERGVPTTFLIVNAVENEVREYIARGENPPAELLQKQEWFALKGIVNGTPIYTRGI